jgi:hypothetical protein
MVKEEIGKSRSKEPKIKRVFILLLLCGSLQFIPYYFRDIDFSSYVNELIALDLSFPETVPLRPTELLPKNISEDWLEKNVWRNHSLTKDHCFILEHVCHEGNEWFYDIGREKEGHFSFQPLPFHLYNGKHNVPEGYFPHDVTITYRSKASDECAYSPVQNHMVLQGSYCIMLGEFYVRVLLGLSEMYSKILRSEWQRELFAKSTQLYLQIDRKKKQLLEGHEMFLGLFTRQRPLSYSGLLDSTNIIHCQCYERLFFCGYNMKTEELLQSLNFKHTNETEVSGGLSLIPADTSFYVPAASFAHVQKGRPAEEYKHLQHLLFQKFVASQSRTQDDIAQHRTEILDGRQDHESWTIVGLAQREGRRRWLDLNNALKRCNSWGSQSFKSMEQETISKLGIDIANNPQLLRKVRCIEVNVEIPKMQNSYQHVLAHASIDALVGVHGAQLTDAVFMKPGSLVVELLPWLPSKHLPGKWTNFAHSVTPLGVNFHNTALNHIGVPLTIDSMPEDHECLSNNSYTLKCFIKINNQWSNSDFRFDGERLVDVLDRFVFVMTRKQAQSLHIHQNFSGVDSIFELPPALNPCQDLVKRAGDEYVLYNVHCFDNVNLTSPHHFYREPDWVFNKTVSNPL